MERSNSYIFMNMNPSGSVSSSANVPNVHRPVHIPAHRPSLNSPPIERFIFELNQRMESARDDPSTSTFNQLPLERHSAPVRLSDPLREKFSSQGINDGLFPAAVELQLFTMDISQSSSTSTITCFRCKCQCLMKCLHYTIAILIGTIVMYCAATLYFIYTDPSTSEQRKADILYSAIFSVPVNVFVVSGCMKKSQNESTETERDIYLETVV